MSPLALQSSQLDEVYPDVMDDNSMSMSERNMGMSDAGYPSYGIGEGQLKQEKKSNFFMIDQNIWILSVLFLIRAHVN